MTDRNRSILFMIISSLSFSLMGATVKYLQTTPLSQKILVRNIVSLIVAFSIVKSQNGVLFGSSTKGRILLTIRSLFGLSGVALLFYATTKLDLADSALFMRLSPFWVTILAFIFLKEHITKVHIFALFLAFVGTLFVMRPWETNHHLLPSIAGLIASFCAAGAYTLVSKLKEYEKPETIVFFFSFVSVVVTLPFALFTKTVPTFSELMGLILVGIFAASGQMFLTHSYRLGKASEVSIFNYMGIIFSTIIGFILWSEIPSLYTIIGAMCIIIAGISTFLWANKK